MIKIISRNDCTNCELIENILNKNKIEYIHINLDEISDGERNDYINKAESIGQTELPIILVNENIKTFDYIKDNIIKKIVKRNGDIKDFDINRIINAINMAMFETGKEDKNLAINIALKIREEVSLTTSVEEIQDMVEQKLMESDRKDVAKRYILYRDKKHNERNVKKEIKQGLLTDEFLSKYKHIPNPMTPLGTFVYYRTYSRWIPELNRREYWWETVKRVVEYNCSLLPTTREEAELLYDNIFNLRQFPSGRSLWIAGTKSAEEYPLANFNCSFVVIDNFKKFGETFHALLVGAGVGFRVLLDDVAQLQEIRGNVDVIHKSYKGKPKNERTDNTSMIFNKNKVEIIIGDSKDGWVESLNFFFSILTDKVYKNIDTIVFNYDNVRPLGEKLKTFGGHASGHTSILNMLSKIFKVIKNRCENNTYSKLKPIDCIDISNIIAENVVVGGTRRSAEIALIDPRDEESIRAKNDMYKQVNGQWIENKEILHRRMSNNTIVYDEKPTKEQLHWNLEQMRFSGEPAFMNMKEAKRRNPNAKGLNPCAFNIFGCK